MVFDPYKMFYTGVIPVLIALVAYDDFVCFQLFIYLTTSINEYTIFKKSFTQIIYNFINYCTEKHILEEQLKY